MNITFNVFYSTFTNILLFLSHFYVFNVFNFTFNVFYVYGLNTLNVSDVKIWDVLDGTSPLGNDWCMFHEITIRLLVGTVESEIASFFADKISKLRLCLVNNSASPYFSPPSCPLGGVNPEFCDEVRILLVP